MGNNVLSCGECWIENDSFLYLKPEENFKEEEKSEIVVDSTKHEQQILF
jgi:hypothetical protein